MISNEKAREILDGAPEGAENFGSSDSGVSYYRCSAYGWEIYVGKEWCDVDKSCGWFTTELVVLEAQLASEDSIANSEEWNGEGLPPVGIKCWAKDYDNEEFPWVKVKTLDAITGSREMAVASVCGNGRYYRLFFACEFKRVETPAELAAKAREGAITKMASTPKPCGHAIYNICADLYDAGYRKIEE